MAMKVDEIISSGTGGRKTCTQCGVPVILSIAGMEDGKCWRCQSIAEKKRLIEENLRKAAASDAGTDGIPKKVTGKMVEQKMRVMDAMGRVAACGDLPRTPGHRTQFEKDATGLPSINTKYVVAMSNKDLMYLLNAIVKMYDAEKIFLPGQKVWVEGEGEDSISSVNIMAGVGRQCSSLWYETKNTRNRQFKPDELSEHDPEDSMDESEKYEKYENNEQYEYERG